jgi:hypothetical protein
MKKLKIMMAMLSMAAVVGFSSCGDDEDETIADAKITMTVRKVVGSTSTIITSGATINSGDSLNVEIKFEGNDKNKLKSYQTTGSWATTTLKSGNLSGTSATVIDGSTVNLPASSYTYTVILTSEKGTITAPFNFTIAGAPASSYTIDVTEAVILGNQADAAAKFWSGKNKNEYFLADAVGNPTLQSAIDLGYATRSSANGGNKIISPNSSDATDIYATQWSATSEKITNWTTRNNTTFILTTLTATAFNNATDSVAIENLISTARAANEPNNQSVNVQDNKIYLYKTQGGRYGLIWVVQATGEVVNNSPQAGQLNFVVKYQRDK